jgi:hypothetical protein
MTNNNKLKILNNAEGSLIASKVLHYFKTAIKHITNMKTSEHMTRLIA